MKVCSECEDVFEGPFCPNCDDGGYGDYMYEQWKDRQFEQEYYSDPDVMTEYEELIERMD